MKHPYELGREDHADGKPISESRFATGTAEFDEWERGWNYEDFLSRYNAAIPGRYRPNRDREG
jgi:hypothetical protein